MTFTLIGFCPATRKIGVCKTTTTPAGGGRSFRIVPGIGALTVQAHTDFQQMDLGVKLLQMGYNPRKVLSELGDSDRFPEHRQIAIVDMRGETAARTGSKARPWSGHIEGNNFVAAGNFLVGEQVVKAMAASFESTASEALEERLLRAVEAGYAAGGQPDRITSSAILVQQHHACPIVNLRVDVALEPLKELRRIFDWYKPLIPHFTNRNEDPTTVRNWKQIFREQGLPLNPYG